MRSLGLLPTGVLSLKVTCTSCYRCCFTHQLGWCDLKLCSLVQIFEAVSTSAERNFLNNRTPISARFGHGAPRARPPTSERCSDFEHGISKSDFEVQCSIFEHRTSKSEFGLQCSIFWVKHRSSKSELGLQCSIFWVKHRTSKSEFGLQCSIFWVKHRTLKSEFGLQCSIFWVKHRSSKSEFGLQC